MHTGVRWVFHAITVRAFVCWLVASVGATQIAQAQTPAPQQPPPQPPPTFEDLIEVVGATPIHGLGIDRNKIPSPGE